MKVDLSNENSTIVIFGATGDLARRKLVPALFQLCCKGRLPEGLRIVGFSRSNYSDDQFRDLMWKGAREFGELAVRQDEWEMFARDLYYVSGDLRQADDIARLEQRLDALERRLLGGQALSAHLVEYSPDDGALMRYDRSGLAPVAYSNHDVLLLSG